MLKIIADDFGLAERVNEGIIHLLTAGKINGTSLMANGAAFDDAVGKLKSAAVGNFSIGAHLVLVEEKSLSGVSLPSDYKIFFCKYILGLIKLTEIEQEARAQLDKIIHSGIKPQFINSHQHLHLLPGISNIIIKLALEYGINYVRLVNEPLNFKGGKFKRKLLLLGLRWLSKLASVKLKQAGLSSNDLFIGFVNAGNMDKNYWEYADNIARQYPKETVELGCHPGFEDETLRKKYRHWGNYHWQQELETLKNYQHG